jgi:hypothetical protein
MTNWNRHVHLDIGMVNLERKYHLYGLMFFTIESDLTACSLT